VVNVVITMDLETMITLKTTTTTTTTIIIIIIIIKLNHSIGLHFCRKISSRSHSFSLSQLGPYVGRFVAIRSFR